MPWRVVGLAIAIAVVSGAAHPRAGERLRVVVGPQISYEPAEVRVTAYVQPNADNRRLLVEADSGAHFTSSDQPLDGDEGSVATVVWLKNLPAGEYELEVRVEHGRGPDTVARGTFEVLGTRP